MKKKKKSAFVEKKVSCTIYSYRLHFVTTQWLL